MNFIDYFFHKYIEKTNNKSLKKYLKIVEKEELLMQKMPKYLQKEFDNYLLLLTTYELDSMKDIIKFTLDTFFEFIRKKCD